MEKFELLLGKDNPLLKSIKDRGFKEPTEIQEKSMAIVMQGKDVIGGASTGSGKTLAFAAGLLNNTEKGQGIQGFVLTPTRELAEQIRNEIADFSSYKDLDVVSVYGGVPMGNQIRRLSDADIVVGTPGRILDHIRNNSIDLSKVNTLVLDEADRMLDMGFIEDVSEIISHCPAKRQTMLFSATISPDIIHISEEYLKDPEVVSAEEYVDPKKLTQVYYDAPDNLKYSLLKHLIENEKAGLVMIFCNTRKNVDFVANNLKLMGIDSLPIHGGFSQEKRNRMLSIFNSQKVNVLVATDVAARGLDIKGVSHVYNYDIPPSLNEYIHRIGRTARAGKEGKVINVVTSRDYENFRAIVNSDFEIKREETPFIKRAMIKWMEPRMDYGDRGSFRGNRNFRSRESSGEGRNFRSRESSRDGRNFKPRGFHRPAARD
jgi:ATP-dependent RNA helicase DeaD